MVLLLNVVTIKFGIEYNALGLISDAMMSLCDCVAMIGEIIADVSSTFPPTEKFSYGYKRSKIICDFSISILLLYITFDLLNASIQSLISIEFDSKSKSNSNTNFAASTVVSSFFALIPPQNMSFLLESPSNANITIDMSVEPISNPGTESKTILLYLAIIGLCVNTFGVFFLGTVHITTCSLDQGGNAMSLITDLLSSVSVVLSSIMSVFFGIEFFDPIVSILISFMIFFIAIQQMRELLNILLQNVPEKFHRADFLHQLDENLTVSDIIDMNAWSLTEETKVVTFRLHKQKKEITKEIRDKVDRIHKKNKKMLISYEVETKL